MGNSNVNLLLQTIDNFRGTQLFYFSCWIEFTIELTFRVVQLRLVASPRKDKLFNSSYYKDPKKTTFYHTFILTVIKTCTNKIYFKFYIYVKMYLFLFSYFFKPFSVRHYIITLCLIVLWSFIGVFEQRKIISWKSYQGPCK